MIYGRDQWANRNGQDISETVVANSSASRINQSSSFFDFDFPGAQQNTTSIAVDPS
jgi:hypothetical protein